MKWLKNLENIAKNNRAGKCPHCKSEDTEYTATKVNGDFGYGVVWCNNCKRAYIISRMRIDKDTVTDKTAPKGLIYD
jgi:transcription elongation factor Elf1